MAETSRARKLARKVELFKRVFDNEQGRAVLAEMKHFCYLTQTTALVSPKTANMDPVASMYNEGKRSVMLHILALAEMDEGEIRRQLTMDEWEQLRNVENQVYGE